jgi:hypothetical protein
MCAGAVGIVLDRLDPRRDVEDVALEVDDAVELLVAAAHAARGHAAVHVAAAGLVLGLGQRALGRFLERPTCLFSEVKRWEGVRGRKCLMGMAGVLVLGRVR